MSAGVLYALEVALADIVSVALASGVLVEKTVDLATLEAAPPKARVNAAQALRIVACGPNEDGELHSALLTRGYESALEATSALMSQNSRQVVASAHSGPTQCVPCP